MRRLRPALPPPALVLACCALAAPAPATATSYVPVPDAALADRATLIVRGTIEDAEVGRPDGRLATDYALAIERVLKGDDAGSRLVVRVPGGVSEELGEALVLWGAPRFRAGETVLLFLRPGTGGAFRLVHFLQGAFFGGSGAAGDPLWLRSQAAPAPARRAAAFEAWIEDRARGLEREPDYLAPAGESWGAAYTRLAGDVPLRWFAFDGGGRVRWHRHRDGQAGLADGGRRAFRRALKSWRRQTGAPIRLRDAGPTGATGGFVIADFRNTILFDDRNEILGDDFDCATGGVIAVGGVSAALLQTADWKGELFFLIDEAEIVVNDGVECLVRGNPAAAEQVYAHELGHTLGLGHSCGDRASPRCSRSAVLDEALMRAFFHDDGRAARLNEDDAAGALTLYARGDFFRAACDLPPGHPRFCRRCGPCGEGQGRCRTDAHCVSPLLCERDRGADYGLDPGVDVCVPPD